MLAVSLGAAACGGAETPAPGGMRGTVTVLAAASLTEAFSLIAEDFQAAHTGVRVRLSFAGSSQLAQQIRSGAPADVFAAADAVTMRRVTDDGHAAGQPQIFARNQLTIAVPEGNPKAIGGLGDLTAAGTKVALCAVQVPCGSAARRALDAAGIALTPVTWEQDVKAALAKVKLGEVDAALVYRTDVRAAENVDAVDFPQATSAVNDYPIVVLTSAPNPVGAEAFVAYVLSHDGQRALASAGFQAP